MDGGIVFDSWGGQFSDNPRAVSEALRRREPSLAQTWVLGDGVEGPDWATRVRAGSEEHVTSLERARFIVANNLLPPFEKAAGTTYVQTWHGTPLKRIGFDLPDADPGYLVHLAGEAQQWDLLVSPSAVSTPRLRSAFRYDGPVAETGYPRNDALARAPARASDGIRVVLYAPTFRHPRHFDLELDLGALADALDADVLLRLHHFAPEGDRPRHPRVHDVTGAPDLRALLLRADALVTDYSSTLVDFAVTGRPIVLFAPDLDHYREELNGFYLDFEATAPGPVVSSTTAVAAALAEPVPAGYAAFRETFCALDDGSATDRVLTAMFDAAARSARPGTAG